jgi:vitamin B12 transporter
MIRTPLIVRISNLSAIALLAIALCPGRAAFADPTPAPSPTATARPLQPVVVTAQRHPTPIDATSRQTWVISSGDLERLGALTAADALRFVPGTVVQQYGAYGSLGTVALRGASSSQTLVLIDGQPANEADTGVFDFSSLPANVIDRIEVVQGGSSTLYGSAAMGGVINILTKRPMSAGNIDAYAQVGYQGTFVDGLGFTLGGPDALARVDVQAVSAANSFAYPGFNALYPAGDRTNSDVKTSDAGVALSGHFGVVVANASLHNDTSSIGTPGSVFFSSDLAQQQRVYQRLNLDLDLPLAHGDIDLQLGSNGRRLHFFDPTQPFPYDNQANGTARSASLRTTLQLGKFQVVTAGYDTSGDTVTFDTAYVPPNSPEPVDCQGVTNFNSCQTNDASSAWYVQDELHSPGAPLTLSLGLRNQRSQGTDPVSVPSAGAVVAVSDWVDLLANYARAFRTPNLDERYYPGYGDPTLQPEYGATYDLGLRGRGEHSEFAVAYFGQDTTNLIINVPIDAFGDVKPMNVSRALVRGVEASMQERFGTFAHLFAAYTDFTRADDLTPGFSGNRLLYRPTSTAALALWVSRGTWLYGVDSTYVGRRFADEANTELMTPYLLTGLHVKKVLNRRLALTVRVDNVGNNHNAEDVLGYPIVGSSFSVRLSTR